MAAVVVAAVAAGSGSAPVAPLTRAPSLQYRVTDSKTALRVEPWVSPDQLAPKPDDNRAIRVGRLTVGGGMYAQVYKLRLHGVDPIAVKMLRNPNPDGAALRAEAAMMMRVACPQVISLYGVTGALDGNDPQCLLMEFAKHGSLRKLLLKENDTGTPVLQSWFRRMRILVDVAKGLARLHQCQPPVVHMDLKPENILICRGLRAKLTDFGCSKLDVTRPATETIGTVSYMAPEALKAHAKPSADWDVWAFSILMYEMMTREAPWPGHSAHQIHRSLLESKRPHMEGQCEWKDGVPTGYEELMNECWSTTPAARPSFVNKKGPVLVNGETSIPAPILPRLIVMLQQARQRAREDKKNAAAMEKQKIAEHAARISSSLLVSSTTSLLIHNNQSALLADVQAQLAAATVRIERDNDAHRMELKKQEAIIEELKQRDQKYAEIINDLNERLELNLAGLDANRIIIRNANELEANLRRQLTMIKAEVATHIDERHQLQSHVTSLTHDNLALKHTISNIGDERDEALATIATLTATCDKLKADSSKNSEKTTRKINELRDALQKKRTDYEQIRNEYMTMRDELNQYRTADGKQPVAGLLSPTAITINNGTASTSTPLMLPRQSTPILNGNGSHGLPMSRLLLTPSAVPSLATRLSSSSSVTEPSFGLHVYGICHDCDAPAKCRVVRRCIECKSEDIDIKEADGEISIWPSMTSSNDGCTHSNSTSTCRSTKWEFVGVCYRHEEKRCALLPGLISNKDIQVICGSCKDIPQVILRFECGHYICLRCWRKYATAKMDSEGLLKISNLPHLTLRCPSRDHCEAYVESDQLFMMLKDARAAQYSSMTMINQETPLGTLELKDKLRVDKKPCPVCDELNTRIGVNNKMRCHNERCRLDWCWACGGSYSASCQLYHLISS